MRLASSTLVEQAAPRPAEPIRTGATPDPARWSPGQRKPSPWSAVEPTRMALIHSSSAAATDARRARSRLSPAVHGPAAGGGQGRRPPVRRSNAATSCFARRATDLLGRPVDRTLRRRLGLVGCPLSWGPCRWSRPRPLLRGPFPRQRSRQSLPSLSGGGCRFAARASGSRLILVPGRALRGQTLPTEASASPHPGASGRCRHAAPEARTASESSAMARSASAAGVSQAPRRAAMPAGRTRIPSRHHAAVAAHCLHISVRAVQSTPPTYGATLVFFATIDRAAKSAAPAWASLRSEQWTRTATAWIYNPRSVRGPTPS